MSARQHPEMFAIKDPDPQSVHGGCKCCICADAAEDLRAGFVLRAGRTQDAVSQREGTTPTTMRPLRGLLDRWRGSETRCSLAGLG